MEEIQEAKRDIRLQVKTALEQLPPERIQEKLDAIENRLFEFANFLESHIVMLYVHTSGEVPTDRILRRSYEFNKMVVLPAFNADRRTMTLLKVDNPDTDLRMGARGILEPDSGRCKSVPMECIDIAIVPALALDEKGGRVGTGEGYYDRVIPRLPATTRKVSLAMEEQIFAQVPMESHDKYVDIIITDERTIYKI